MESANNSMPKTVTRICPHLRIARLDHGSTCLRNINEVYSASAFIFIFSYRAELTPTFAKALAGNPEYQHDLSRLMREQKALAVG